MVLREITFEDTILRLLSSILIGGFIGLERGMKKRPAGLRTYMLGRMIFNSFFTGVTHFVRTRKKRS